jgi:hypothetical protein
MPVTSGTGAGGDEGYDSKKYKPPKPPGSGHRGSKGKGKGKGSGKGKGHGKGHKPPKPKKVHPGKWREAASHPAGADTHATSGAVRLSHPAGSGLPALTLAATESGFATLHGLSGMLLDLVGEGAIGLGHALAAFATEQTRLTNRAWRRPGGLARMGSL